MKHWKYYASIIAVAAAFTSAFAGHLDFAMFSGMFSVAAFKDYRELQK